MAASLDRYASDYAVAQRGRDGWPEWLARISDDALGRFLELGFPTSRDEEWRFTSVAALSEQAFTLRSEPASQPADAGIDAYRLAGRTGAELVFVDGVFMPALSKVGGLAEGVQVKSLADAVADADKCVERYLTRVAPIDRQPFIALNTAFLRDGAYVHVPARTIVHHPIHLLFVSTASNDWGIIHPRVLLVLGEASQASVVESYGGATGGRYFTNGVTEIVLADGAVLDHYKIQRESAEAYHIGASHVMAGRSANAASHSISFGGSLVRNDVVVALKGEGAECTLNGLYLADAQRLVDNHTTIDHAKPHCGSREVYKGILAEHARGVFNGKIIVRPDAQKTDAKQTNRALLLSEEAQINTKPQLEIFANDVKCTHGAAIGQLDDEAVFYLRSRGLGAAEARRLLIHAFAADIVTRMPLEPIRASVEDILQRQLAHVLARAA
jgi:Fe-S cluster assembly protein SufD